MVSSDRKAWATFFVSAWVSDFTETVNSLTKKNPGRFVHIASGWDLPIVCGTVHVYLHHRMETGKSKVDLNKSNQRTLRLKLHYSLYSLPPFTRFSPCAHWITVTPHSCQGIKSHEVCLLTISIAESWQESRVCLHNSWRFSIGICAIKISDKKWHDNDYDIRYSPTRGSYSDLSSAKLWQSTWENHGALHGESSVRPWYSKWSGQVGQVQKRP